MTSGPFDSEQITDDSTRLDLGCVRICVRRGLEVRVDLDPDNHRASSISIFLGHSIIALQIFAAPRHEDMWPNIRDGIVANLAKQGVTTDVVLGKFGTEIHATMPTVDYDATTIMQTVRFLGVDGPRWFIRAVVTGEGSMPGSKFDEVDTVIADLVIHRGTDAMAPGEHLPIVMPDSEGPVESELVVEDSTPDEADFTKSRTDGVEIHNVIQTSQSVENLQLHDNTFVNSPSLGDTPASPSQIRGRRKK